MHDDEEMPVGVDVWINGQEPDNGEFIEGVGWTSVTFTEGSQVEIKPRNGEGQITIQPSVVMAASFKNDIGLDLDLTGTFEAFAISLSAFGKKIFGIDPLLNHKHSLYGRDLGSIFRRSFDLPEQTIELLPFEVSFVATNGKTAATAFVTQPAEDGSGNDIPNTFEKSTNIAAVGTYYFETPVFDWCIHRDWDQ